MLHISVNIDELDIPEADRLCNKFVLVRKMGTNCMPERFIKQILIWKEFMGKILLLKMKSLVG